MLQSLADAYYHIKIGLSLKALELIRRHKNSDQDNPYLFPILEADLPASTVKHRTPNFLKWINLRMNQIAEDLGIDKTVTTYATRNSFSTVMKRKGISTQFIKESLGQSSTLTTASYLDSFANDEEKLSVFYLLTEL